MYMSRKADCFLAEWKQNPDRKPLIVKGPRQVGKTETIRRFAAENYESVIEINFVEEPKYETITSDGYKAEDIIKNISLIDPSKKFIEGNTLIFFDELQQFPDISTSLKFFKQDGRFDVICSGSMLGINYRKIESNSVGYKSDFMMFSMDFEEFLWAKGYGDDFTENLFKHMAALKPLSETELSVCRSLFLDYCVLGGMPAVVSDYITKKTFEGSLETQRQLIADYKEDIRKYAEGVDQTRILNVFNRIAPQLAKENKKFQI
ncbi:MAG: AAA family ATPase, partial [Ruminococcus sp.]|nr:AAA family ATPase [Ruminococcus sp.]